MRALHSFATFCIIREKRYKTENERAAQECVDYIAGDGKLRNNLETPIRCYIALSATKVNHTRAIGEEEEEEEDAEFRWEWHNGSGKETVNSEYVCPIHVVFFCKLEDTDGVHRPRF